MADVDGFLAICGPPFLSHELVLEQVADHRILNNLVVDLQRVPACSEPDHEIAQLFTTSLQTMQNYIIQQQNQQTHHDSAEASIVGADPAAVPVIRGKRGLCYDVNQVADTKLRNRLLKNRERADQSRKRKLEEIRRHEQLLEDLDTENKRLKDINAALLNRIAEIETALFLHTVMRDNAQSVS